MQFYNNIGQQINCGIKEARKHEYYPSVTTVLDILRKWGIEEYQKKQCIISAITMPRNENESDKDFVERILTEADEDRREKANIGTSIHLFISKILKNEKTPINTELKRFIYDWLQENIIESYLIEKSLLNYTNKFAGTIDFFGKIKEYDNCIIDWKTQFTDKSKKIYFNKYNEWSYQLAAYSLLHKLHNFSDSFMGNGINYLNVVFSTGLKPDVKIYQWSSEDIEKGSQIFMNCLSIFKLIKNI